MPRLQLQVLPPNRSKSRLLSQDAPPNARELQTGLYYMHLANRRNKERLRALKDNDDSATVSTAIGTLSHESKIDRSPEMVAALMADGQAQADTFLREREALAQA